MAQKVRVPVLGDLLLTAHPAIWREEAALIGPHYEMFGGRLPRGLWDEHAALLARLDSVSA